ncbi:MAG TPA: hypothetical protein VGE96_00905 [Steroidobacteraceae bacterium]
MNWFDRHHFHHFDEADRALVLRFVKTVESINERGARMEPITQQIVDAVAGLVQAVTPLPGAVNALEAAVTAATSNTTGMSQEDKNALAAALANIQDVAKTIGDSVSDAQDGIDEAAQQGTGEAAPEQPTT